MTVHLHPHAQERIKERGTSLEEVIATVENGEKFPAKYGRAGFRRNFFFRQEFQGRFYDTKQLEVYAKQENSDWLVITVIVRYF